MYLKRKMDDALLRWLRDPHHSPALVIGVRQCGKTETIRRFCVEHFQYVQEINFWTHPDAIHIFDGSLEVDELLMRISIYFPSFRFEEGKTILFFDEIQDCPRARLAFKNFKSDGRFEVIGSGSYIGVNIARDPVPTPNGSEDVIYMFPLDFEEYLWAKGFSPMAISMLEESFKKRTAIDSTSHGMLLSIFREFLCIGGFPETIKIFVESKSFKRAYDKNASLIFDMKSDPAKRTLQNGAALYTPAEVARIQRAFDLIPAFGTAKNYRFVASKINGNSMQRADAVNFLCNAGIAIKVTNLTAPSLPFKMLEDEGIYKLFFVDPGILTASFGYEEVQMTIKGELGQSKGYLFETAVASELIKQGIPLHYFSKPSGLEIDFVIAWNGKVRLVEAKAKSGDTKSAKEVMGHPEKYGPTSLIKIGEYNISETNGIMTIPYYLLFLLGRNRDQ